MKNKREKAEIFKDISFKWRDFRLQEITELNEARDYPTQDEAEKISEFIDFLDEFSWGLSGKARELYGKIEKFRAPYFEYAFGDKSPWRRNMNKKGAKRVEWDEKKAGA